MRDSATREPAEADADGRSGPVAVRLKGHRGSFALDIAFEAPAKGVTALFGRSGSGKTSVLRAIAGLERLEGHVAIGGAVWQDGTRFLPPHRRAVGYVFQEASLFPHLTVAGNIRYGARRSATPPSRQTIEETIALMGIGPLLARRPNDLSGGERQRVAMARAILSQPNILLMDEPLAALDRSAKDALLPTLEALHARLGIPVLFVSHDISEVERLADNIVVLEGGRVKAAGALNAALTDSGLGFVRDPHAAAVVDARVTGFDPDDFIAALDLAGQPVFVAMSRAPDIGTLRRLRIEASDVSLSRETPAPSTILNRLDVVVRSVEPSGPSDMAVLLSPAGGDGTVTFVARVTRRSAKRLAIAAGDRMIAQIKSVSLATS